MISTPTYPTYNSVFNFHLFYLGLYFSCTAELGFLQKTICLNNGYKLENKIWEPSTENHLIQNSTPAATWWWHTREGVKWPVSTRDMGWDWQYLSGLTRWHVCPALTVTHSWLGHSGSVTSRHMNHTATNTGSTSGQRQRRCPTDVVPALIQYWLSIPWDLFFRLENSQKVI